MVDFFRGIICQENDGVKMPGTGEQGECVAFFVYL